MVVALHIQCRLFHSLVMLMIVPLGCCDDFMIQSFLDVLEAVAPVSSGCDVIVPQEIQTFGFMLLIQSKINMDIFNLRSSA